MSNNVVPKYARPVSIPSGAKIITIPDAKAPIIKIIPSINIGLFFQNITATTRTIIRSENKTIIQGSVLKKTTCLSNPSYNLSKKF